MSKRNKQKSKGRGLNLPLATGKLYWSDGYWTDERWSESNTQSGIVQKIRQDWDNLEWVKTTDWYKSKLLNNQLEKH